VKILHIYISPEHNYIGHHGQPPGAAPSIELPCASLVAGKGIEGDRFFDYKEDYKGQVTFFSKERYVTLCQELGVTAKEPDVFRRNIIVEGVDLNALIGKEFTVQGIRFLGVCECTPCAWMDLAFHPGAHAALKGHGGLRAKVLTDGVISVDEEAD
jgi:MOSC domain-containing protein YiiM